MGRQANRKRKHNVTKDDRRYLYFAYGSNLSREQMRRRCPDAVEMMAAKAVGWRLEFSATFPQRRHGVATMVPYAEATTEGVIWSLSAEDLERLDGYEGVPHAYQRYTVDVEVSLGKVSQTLNCMVYLQDYCNRLRTPAEDYAVRIAAEYGRRGFKLDRVLRAIKRAVKADKADKADKAEVIYYPERKETNRKDFHGHCGSGNGNGRDVISVPRYRKVTGIGE